MSDCSFEYYGHASVLMKADDVNLLTDPWFYNSSQTGSVGAYPAVKVPTAEEIKNVNAIQISHIHTDHFCKASLTHFPKDIPVFITKAVKTQFYDQVKSCGFTNIIQIPPGFDGVSYKGLQLFQFPMRGSPSFDSSLVIEHNDKFYFLNNDSIHETFLFDLFQMVWGKFTGVFTNYSVISPEWIAYDYSNSLNLTHKLSPKEILGFYHKSAWQHVSDVCAKLKPDWVVPYASGMRFFESDCWSSNLAFLNPNEIEKIETSGAKKIVLWPGDEMNSIGEIIKRKTQPPSASIQYGPYTVPENFKVSSNSRSVSKDIINSQLNKIVEYWLIYLKGVSQSWLSPMKFRYNLIAADGKVSLDFAFDGQAIHFQPNSNDQVDLDIDYPARLFLEVISGRARMEKLHYSFNDYFKVRVHRLIYGQQAVYLWNDNWKIPPLELEL